MSGEHIAAQFGPGIIARSDLKALSYVEAVLPYVGANVGHKETHKKWASVQRVLPSLPLNRFRPCNTYSQRAPDVVACGGKRIEKRRERRARRAAIAQPFELNQKSLVLRCAPPALRLAASSNIRAPTRICPITDLASTTQDAITVVLGEYTACVVCGGVDA